MKKLFVLILAVALFVPAFAQAQDETGGLSPRAWVLIGADTVLCAATVLAVVQQNTLAADYEKLVSNMGDNYDEAGYWRMKYEREKVTAAEDLVLISAISAGAALAYTALDLFWLHHVFDGDVKVKTGFNPYSAEYSVLVSTDF